MDFLYYKMWFEQKRLKYSKWLKMQRGIYTNGDFVTDQLQMLVIILQGFLLVIK